MHRAIGLFLLLAPASAGSHQEAPPPQPVRCENRADHETFGATEWIIYSCDDEVSLVVISAQGNPASPFVFHLRRGPQSYQVVGEGNGDEGAGDAAGADLAELSSAEIAALLADIKVAQAWGRRFESCRARQSSACCPGARRYRALFPPQPPIWVWATMQ